MKALPFGMVLFVVGCGPIYDYAPYMGEVESQKWELMALHTIVLDRADANKGRMPAFDSKALPQWALPGAAEKEIAGNPTLIAAYDRALGRPWSYRVPRHLVGVKVKSIPLDTMIIREVGFGPKAELLGICLRGEVVVRPLNELKKP